MNFCQRELESGETCPKVATTYQVMVDAATRIAYQVRLCEEHSTENTEVQNQPSTPVAIMDSALQPFNSEEALVYCLSEVQKIYGGQAASDRDHPAYQIALIAVEEASSLYDALFRCYTRLIG
jgi:hypothetical protein